MLLTIRFGSRGHTPPALDAAKEALRRMLAELGIGKIQAVAEFAPGRKS
ncbi:hypothetical protein [Edaphobacter dinghuensis]|nr:hypothetical protein [Edaphobacter dinghuensis]